MNRSLLSRTGFLLTLTLALVIALPVLTFPQQTHALSESCQTILGIQPVSQQYTGKVLARANAGLAYAKEAPDANLLFYFAPWAETISSSWLSLVDTQQRITDRQRSLSLFSACRRLDSLLIECTMDEVRDEMSRSLDRGSFVGILRLQSLLAFLNERLEHLTAGGDDPSYVDATWGERQLFDPPAPVWCCAESNPANSCSQVAATECTAGGGATFESLDRCLGFGCREPEDIQTLPEEEGSLFPFHSDYLDPMESGWGCDLTIMTGSRLSYPALAAEESVLRTIEEQRRIYREQTTSLLTLEQQLDWLGGGQMAPFTPPAPRQHKTAFGTDLSYGQCQMDPAVSCVLSLDCIEADAGFTCVYAPGSCTGNLFQRCTADDECAITNTGTCGPGLQETVPLTTLRDAFSARKNHLRILSLFTQQRMDQGGGREFTDDLKQPAEFGPGQAGVRAVREGADPFQQAVRPGARYVFAFWSKLQGKSESAIFPAASDTQLSIAHDLQPLRTAVAELTRLSSSREGIRNFVIGLAYFLRRTCLERPCSLRLEQILKLAFTDACFPQTLGVFSADSDDESAAWKICAKAACIRLPGVELPESCEGIP